MLRYGLIKSRLPIMMMIPLAFFPLVSCVSPPPISNEAKQGIASHYPNDVGIEKDPRVVFYENFENAPLEEIVAKWGSAGHKNNLSITETVAPDSVGRKALRIKDNGHLFSHFKGIDTLFARFYVKFHKKTGYPHHLVSLIADSNPKPWPKGGAGRAPGGDQRFSVNIDTNGLGGRADPPGIWCFYNYWHEMRGGWGNYFYESYDQVLPDRWYCVEVMIKANSSPEKLDGEQAFWIDGVLKGHFRRFRWRTSNALKLNTIWLSYYVTQRNMLRNRDYQMDQRKMEIWFDDIVVATQYIGPIVPK